jgi:LEA14-like dessication related protein
MNTHKRSMLTTFLLFAPLLLVGCNKALAPDFEAVGVQEIERVDGRSVIEFRVRATNPNAEPIPLRTVTYRVEINGEQVFDGVRSPETTLHTYSESEFVLPAVVPVEFLSGSIDYALLGSVQYIPPGRLSEVLFDAEIRVPEAVLDLQGTIDAGS